MHELKARLRAEAKARRSALGAEERKRAAAAIAGHGLAFAGLGAANTVSGFSAIGEEIDARPLMMRLHGEGHGLCLPVLQGKGHPLLFRRWQPGDGSAPGVWGIEQPLPTAPAVEPDMLLVPLLAFDAAGYRLGYGGGYYDRTLRALRAKKPIVAIGVAFDEQRLDAVPHLDYDERLDWVLTPSGPVKCA